MSTESAKSLKLFYCYAHEDKVLRDELDKHLSDLKREYQIASWSDGEIIPGVEWQKEIDAQLNTANIILLLISADFIKSHYCYSIEMKRALERHDANTARVIPIIVRPVYWENASFSKLQVLPTDAKPVTQWLDRDEAFRNITMGIRNAIIALTIPLKTEEELYIQQSRTEVFRLSKPQSMTFDSITNKTRKPMQRRVYGGIEGGGTKFNCMIGADPYHALVTKTFPTTDPKRTLDEVTHFFRHELRGHELAAIGMGSFGPIDLNPASATYGYITTTPKSGWEYTNIVGTLEDRLGVPVAFDTDVNAAALGEYRWGAAQGCDPIIYITVGTGIGGGVYVNGALLHGLIHPEMGHLPIPRLDGDDFPSVCPYHNHCWEGIASGPAIAARVGRPAQDLTPDDPVWEIEAQYLAMAITSIMYIASPYRIILGGGVMRQEHLFPRIRQHVQRLLNGYLHHPAVLEDNASFIVPPKLGSHAGLFGALELARLVEAKHIT